MDQDATWQRGRPRPMPHCIIWGSSGDPGPTAAPPHFGPCLLWPNGRSSQQLLNSCINLLHPQHIGSGVSALGLRTLLELLADCTFGDDIDCWVLPPSLIV